jgi:hypothetical protein
VHLCGGLRVFLKYAQPIAVVEIHPPEMGFLPSRELSFQAIVPHWHGRCYWVRFLREVPAPELPGSNLLQHSETAKQPRRISVYQ